MTLEGQVPGPPLPGAITGSIGTLANIMAYNLVGQVVGAALTPFIASLQQQLLRADPVIPLAPAELAVAVRKGIIDEGTGAAEATLSGVNGDRFGRLVEMTGEAPAPASLAEALRRKIISDGQFTAGIKQNGLRPEYADAVRQLAVHQPSPEAMLNALLEGQIDEGTARDLYEKLGGDLQYFQILFDSQGQAPTPTQALELANRGIIPWGGSGAGAVSYEQAFLEGPWRNKWLSAFQALGTYIPPPRTITAMYREGSLTADQATKYLMDHGITADLAAAYLTGAHNTKIAAHKLASESTVTTGYVDGLLDRGSAMTHLKALGYSDTEADFVLSVADVKVEHSFLRSAMGRVNGAFVAGKIDRAAAQADLSALKVPPETAGTLLDLWEQEKATNIRTLTAGQIAQAYKYKIMDAGTAENRLMALGYKADDAAILIAIAHHGPLDVTP